MDDLQAIVNERSSPETDDGTACVAPQLGNVLGLTQRWSMSISLASALPPGAGERQCSLSPPLRAVPLAQDPHDSFQRITSHLTPRSPGPSSA